MVYHFEMQTQKYFLCSERLGFRSWQTADFLLAKGLWGDPEVTRLFSKQPLSDEQIEERLRAEIKREKVYRVQYWPIFELSSGEHTGCCGLRPYQPEKEIFELGFHLRTSCWGKGYATEASRTVLDYARSGFGIKNIFAGHHPENTSSAKVLLKLGFKPTGTVFYKPTGLYHPSYMLELKSCS
jgi:RimJ/RimL family protein N-acetyltransferase